MESKRVLSSFIIALVLVSCQGAPNNSSTESSSNESASKTLNVTLDATTVSQGSFENAERPTSGTVKVAESKETYHVVLESDFRTSKGPDLQVVLHRSNNLLTELSPPTFPLQGSDYVVVGSLKSLKGEQSYPIPSNIKIEDYKSVAIWCEKFNATFGAARLQAPS